MHKGFFTTAIVVLVVIGQKNMTLGDIEVPVNKAKNVQYEGKDIVLRDKFNFPAEEKPWIRQESEVEEISPAERAEMIQHLHLKEGAKLFRVRQGKTGFKFVAQIGDKRYPLNEELVGSVFENIDTGEQAEELVSLVQRGRLITSHERYRKFTDGCNAIDKTWVKAPDAPFVGSKAQRWEKRADLFLVRTLVAEGTRVLARDYLVDKEGHITEVKTLTCVNGPLTMDGATSVSASYLKFMELLKQCCAPE